VREFTQVVAELTITDDEELRTVRAEYRREGMKKNVDSLPMYETRDGADHQLVTRRTQGLGRVSSL
jgi:ssRNA-specific RNase YbeY (16S rRNA maturation enzyme)